jgi:hypothetical protein
MTPLDWILILGVVTGTALCCFCKKIDRWFTKNIVESAKKASISSGP